MANTQIKVPLFAAAEVLTAANMNISAGTGIPVFATTVTRDAAFGGAGEKVLAEGQFAFLEDTNETQFYDGSTWQSVGGASGLTLISTTTIGTTVSSVTVSNAFSATYQNYKIIMSGGVSSGNVYLKMTLGATATGYYMGMARTDYTTGTASVSGLGANNQAQWTYVLSTFTGGGGGIVELQSPFDTTNTLMQCFSPAPQTGSSAHSGGGFLNNSTSYTAFTFTPASGTLTGGTIKVYGYQNS
jgi:hypothetical protein